MPEIAQIMRWSAGARRGVGRVARGSQRLAGLHATAMGPGTVLGHRIITDMLTLLCGRLTLSFSLLVFCDMHLTSQSSLAAAHPPALVNSSFLDCRSKVLYLRTLCAPTDGGF